jgi:hypothetical protein
MHWNRRGQFFGRPWGRVRGMHDVFTAQTNNSETTATTDTTT